MAEGIQTGLGIAGILVGNIAALSNKAEVSTNLLSESELDQTTMEEKNLA